MGAVPALRLAAGPAAGGGLRPGGDGGVRASSQVSGPGRRLGRGALARDRTVALELESLVHPVVRAVCVRRVAGGRARLAGRARGTPTRGGGPGGAGVSLFPWYVFCLLFLLPFLDPRRPLRLLHFDLVILLAAGIWPLDASMGTEPPAWTAAIPAAGLLWLLGRLLWAGFRPRRSSEPLVPLLPTSWLAVVVVVLVCLRIGSMAVSPAYVSDVGIASIIGADLIGDGQGVYDGQVHRELPHGDTYGPVTYLAYVPFEQVIPWPGSLRPGDFEQPKPAYAAAAVFDVLVLLGLFLLGRVMQRGPNGDRLGLALAYAWAAFPFALLTLRFSFSDTVVGLLALWAVVALRYPFARGGLAALAGATKFAPLVLAPLLATGTGERRVRSSLVFAVAFVAVTAARFPPPLPP